MMVPLKIIRKIGKILRGGAGRQEILLGMLLGVLIGFNPGVNMALLFVLLITLLFNANFSFFLLGAALGKVLCLAMAPITFHTGYVIIHDIGMENFFRALCNAPVTALMDLNVYAMVGGIPYAIVIGGAVGVLLGTAVIRIRRKMMDANQHEIIGKTFGSKCSRILLRLAFGKSRLSLDEEVPQQAPLLRKSGLILVGSVLLIGLVLEILLLDLALKKGIQSSISAVTGAEVNVGRVHFSIGRGELEIANLQVTDADKPTHNLIQLSEAAVDISISDLLRNSYVIDLMSGHTVKRDVRRARPGEVYDQAPAEKIEEEAEPEKEGRSLDDYFAGARDWKRYGEKAQEYLATRKENIQAAKRGEQPAAPREEAVADAKTVGYLSAEADLIDDRPAWTIRKMEIHDVELGESLPPYLLEGSQLSSHPEINRKRTDLSLTREGATEPDAMLVLRFDNVAASHAFTANIKGISLDDAMETGDSIPVNITGGKADIKTDGIFSANALQLPFTVTVRDLNISVEEGEEVMGMDAETATEVFNSLEQFEIEGMLAGARASPRVRIDYEKLGANIREALVAAGKKELSRRADAEMDKARAALEKKAGEEVDKALESEEVQDLKEKAGESLKNLF